MSTRTRSAPRPPDVRTPYGARLGDEDIRWFQTRAGAINMLQREVEHWIRHARMFESASLEELETLRGVIGATWKPAQWTFTIGGVTGYLAYEEQR
jgi:hypothetical protein